MPTKNHYTNTIYQEYQSAVTITQNLPFQTVTFYGGANVEQNTKVYQDAYELAIQFTKLGWGVVTGGGLGVMKAGSDGTKSVDKNKSIVYQMKKIDQQPSGTDNHSNNLIFENFAPRKFALRQSDIYVYFSGGLGTLDELMENLNLIKTQKTPSVPIYLYDSSYWAGLIDWLTNTTLQRGLLDKSFLDVIKIVDTPTQIIAKIKY